MRTLLGKRKPFSLLAVGLFLLGSVAVMPTTDAKTVDVNQYVDTIWNTVCNPINPAATQSDTVYQVKECQNIDDLIAWATGISDNPCGSSDCVQGCSGGETGFSIDGTSACATIGYSGLCSGNQVGVIADGFALCYTPGYTGPCDGGQSGYYVDGVNACFDIGPTGWCSGSKIGVIVDGLAVCITRPANCSSGEYGVPPDCVIPPPTCPTPSVGIGPYCGKLAGESCDDGGIGTTPVCAKVTTNGYGATVTLQGAQSIGYGMSPNQDELALDQGVATANCKGAPILSMACAGSAVDAIHVCAKVDGGAGPFTVHAEACGDAGGTATMVGTGSLYAEQRHDVADIAGHKTRPVPDKQVCDSQIPPPPFPAVFGGCYWTYKAEENITRKHDQCDGGNQWADQAVANLIGNPTNISGWLPGWNLQECPAVAAMAGDYDCFDGTTSGHAQADQYPASDSASLPSCKGKGQRDAGTADAEALQATAVKTDSMATPSSSSVVKISPPKSSTFRISLLSAADHANLTATMRQRFDALVNTTIENACAVGQPTDPTARGMLQDTCEKMKKALIIKMDQALAEDFLVRVA